MKLNIVPAATGMSWVRSGVRAFFRQPVALAGLFLMFMVMISIVSMVPGIGKVLALALLPATTLALLVAGAETHSGTRSINLVVRKSVKAVRSAYKPLLTLGGLYALGFMLVMGISATMDGGALARIYLFNGELTEDVILNPDFQLAVLVAVTLYMPLSMLFWHAPALVHWNGVTPAKSLFFSMVACMRNFWPFTVYTVAWLAAFVSVTVLVAIVASLFNDAEIISGMVMPLLIVMAAMYFTSIYYTYRDCFSDDGPATPTSAVPTTDS